MSSQPSYKSLGDRTRDYFTATPMVFGETIVIDRQNGELRITCNGVELDRSQLDDQASDFLDALFRHPCLNDDAIVSVRLMPDKVRIRVRGHLTWAVAGKHIEQSLDYAYGTAPAPAKTPEVFKPRQRLYGSRRVFTLAGHELRFSFVPCIRRGQYTYPADSYMRL